MVKIRKNNEIRGVADTSKKAFSELKESGKLSDQARKVFDVIRDNSPINSRQIASVADLERNSITRAIYDLEELGKVYVFKKDKCPITGKTVKFYSSFPSLFNV